MKRSLTSLCATALIVGLGARASAGPVDFVTQVQPLLETKCVECHNPTKTKGKLQMHSAEALLKGGENGAIVVAGKPEESEIIKRISVCPRRTTMRCRPKAMGCLPIRWRF